MKLLSVVDRGVMVDERHGARRAAEAGALSDSELALQRRAADLIARMTLEEKALQMQSTAPAAQR